MSGKRRGKVEKPRKYRKGLKANYGGATPEEVALAVLRYRPGKKKQAEAPPLGHRKGGEAHGRTRKST